ARAVGVRVGAVLGTAWGLGPVGGFAVVPVRRLCFYAVPTRDDTPLRPRNDRPRGHPPPPRDEGMSDSPMQALARAVRQSGLIRFFEHFAELYPTAHLKDLVVEAIGPGREMVVAGRRVVNFGSDSFLGLDLDPRVQQAVRRGLDRWGTHNGASRAFASVAANVEAEQKLAAWLGTEAALVYPSVTLANMGAIPGLVGKQDVLVIDEQAHNSMQEAAKIAKANGTRVLSFSHCNPTSLARILDDTGPYRCAVVAIDGVYSMSGELPPLAELNDVCLARRAVLYVDDAHGTGGIGTRGRRTRLGAP